MSIQNDLKEIAKARKLQLDLKGEGYKLTLTEISDHTCVLEIGPDEYEWYLTILDTNKEAKYSDWLDYHGYDRSPKSDLVKKKLSDLKWVIDSWNSAEAIELTKKKSFFGLFKKTIGKWKLDGNWVKIQLHKPD